MIQVTIISPNGIMNEIKDAKAVHAVLVDGSRITILPNHAPLLAQLQDGIIQVITSKRTQVFPTSSGILRIKDNKISVLTNTIVTEREPQV